MKQGQMLSQPFIYIFAMVTIALVIFFGFYMVKQTSDLGCTVEGGKFVKDFERKINEVYSLAEDSKLNFDMLPPSSVRGICFTDKEDLSAVPFRDVRNEMEIRINTGGLDSNMFFSLNPGADKTCLPGAEFVDNLVIDGLLCFDFSTGKFNFDLEKQEGQVLITKKNG
jgi:hypothetical protein